MRSTNLKPLKHSALPLLVLLLAVLPGSAERNRQFFTEAQEKVQDPPTYIYRREATARMVSQFGAFTSYQVNVDANGNNITNDAANEPSICVDPTNHNRMAIGWRQFNSIASNFRQAGWAYTSNGGTTWAFPGVLQNNVFRSDPVLGTDDSGHFFYLSLLQSFFVDMWRSLINGQSWANLGAAFGGDKQWFTIDRSPGSIGHGFQYQAWSGSSDGNNFNGRQFSRSTDGGLNWSDPVNIPNAPSFGTLDVDSTGNLYVGGLNLDTGQIWCARSTNAKMASATPMFDQSTAVNLGGDINSGAINPVGLVGQVWLAVDRSGGTTNNNVYMLASVLLPGLTGSNVMFVRSTNAGASFSAPRRINDDPVNPNKWHWFGALAVAPNGRIDVIWFDTRYAANNTDSQLFYSYSRDGGNTWSANVPVTTPFNPFVGYPNQNKIGDYITMVSDNSGGDVAYTATFNGEEDIYYVRVQPNAAPTATELDFNGDGKPDYVLYNAATRQTAIWYLNNNAFVSGAYGPTLPPGWGVAGAADFNSDSHPDYALFNSFTHQTALWYLSGPTYIGGAYGPPLPNGWELVATADFNGDNKPDYVLYNAGTHQTAVWYLNNNLFLSGAYGPTLPVGWSVVGVADFNRDSHADYALFNPGTRQTAIWYLSGATLIRGAYGPTLPSGWALVATADFNGDGHPDYVLENAGTRQTAIWYLNNNAFVSGAYGPTLPAGWSLVAP